MDRASAGLANSFQYGPWRTTAPYGAGAPRGGGRKLGAADCLCRPRRHSGTVPPQQKRRAEIGRASGRGRGEGCCVGTPGRGRPPPEEAAANWALRIVFVGRGGTVEPFHHNKKDGLADPVMQASKPLVQSVFKTAMART